MKVSKNKAYASEDEMYSDVIAWLKTRLRRSFLKKQIDVVNTSRMLLWRFLESRNYYPYFSDYLTYEIQVDITGVIVGRKDAKLVFVECKLNRITLKDISQLLGYSRVAKPYTSLLISPKGISPSVDHLLNAYRRYDVLEYAEGRSILIGRWDPVRKEVDVATLLPKGRHLFDR
ncbi:MAG: hypothetical protein DRP63_06115 [Planctomycetota bacterium]|nr:MAG: hypothetical protein DRP63_06115 [Planctomycetota bacterium]